MHNPAIPCAFRLLSPPLAFGIALTIQAASSLQAMPSAGNLPKEELTGLLESSILRGNQSEAFRKTLLDSTEWQHELLD
ncbi:MAG: hypothetical protein O3A87_04870 [Verrucomicrobia bacterium]|nr:hypothetical protein [Verrucomicrobiota bacterium]MDA1005800.1 hypothetical protein [Verrucomicrobiota bacterium]